VVRQDKEKPGTVPSERRLRTAETWTQWKTLAGFLGQEKTKQNNPDRAFSGQMAKFD
jgi:hypothetical protein